MKNELDETPATSSRILANLMNDPDSQETLKRALDRRLMQEDIKRDVALVKKAVDRLIHKGFLLERNGKDRTKYYQVNRKRLLEISASLRKERRRI